MKKRLFLKSSLIAIAAVFAVSCDDDVTLGSVDTGNLAVPEGSVVYVTDVNWTRTYSVLEFRETQTTPIYLNAPA
ncbi:MAG: hypothetical protein K2J17_06130, partial [Paramuribaculum sp.]|nr:hypothetical protein [Paramuribaculum sp.]